MLYVDGRCGTENGVRGPYVGTECSYTRISYLQGPRVPSHATAREAGVRCPDYVHGQQVKRAQCQRVSD